MNRAERVVDFIRKNWRSKSAEKALRLLCDEIERLQKKVAELESIKKGHWYQKFTEAESQQRRLEHEISILKKSQCESEKSRIKTLEEKEFWRGRCWEITKEKSRHL